ncbi:unnamed protein product [Fusarium graminearum]|uniref:Chromosome 1, complete genome n=1 Tax=Gibberella zeae (strain ATCC MYA-4620 / CBS 123657 / FGSC 9075 / NRRL 31084 / PH-1) TaxID=229533 RepID=I1S4Y3_GIBZE|nr:hypothetical protein FGSG_11901 [Fusarium graminearum PH-1]ESU06389.1 hypothetical protein FGSG_11901 [Fusarium graminearum PH-1]EYB33880.1 hypothetical protein FG05_11901 [Fusarium graminearum]CEF73185.1 unnamed protein product [Fusarium graminearum]CZS76456.1 unnamed protein product [Fusarium graminearum]|eukprot:XP_011316874.1 hypothetical protein FGSG_11901 [Fusarium graminearum PH-1]
MSSAWTLCKIKPHRIRAGSGRPPVAPGLAGRQFNYKLSDRVFNAKTSKLPSTDSGVAQAGKCITWTLVNSAHSIASDEPLTKTSLAAENDATPAKGSVVLN